METEVLVPIPGPHPDSQYMSTDIAVCPLWGRGPPLPPTPFRGPGCVEGHGVCLETGRVEFLCSVRSVRLGVGTPGVVGSGRKELTV